MVDWTQLQLDSLETISKRLTSDVDYIQFRSTCTTWRSAAPKKQHLPWLVLPGKPNAHVYGFLSPTDEQKYEFQVPEEAVGMRCCGSSHGWLILVDDTTLAFLLCNPITQAKIYLAPLMTSAWRVPKTDIHGYEQPGRRENMNGYHVKKAILSSNPTSNISDFVVMAIFYTPGAKSKLAFCRPGDEEWTIVDESTVHFDVVFFGDRFYAMDRSWRFIVCDVGPPVKVTVFHSPDYPWKDGSCYLVESSGDLLAIVRYGGGTERSDTDHHHRSDICCL